MNSTVTLSLFSIVGFTLAIVVLITRRNSIDLKADVLLPLISSLFLYDCIVISNALEHSKITSYFDPLEDIAEIVFVLIFLFFINNWRKNHSEVRFRKLFKLTPVSLAEISMDGRIIEVNDSLKNELNEYYGISKENVSTIYAWWEVAFPDPSTRTQILSEWQKDVERTFKTGEPIKSIEREMTCRNGTKRTVIMSGGLNDKNILLSLVDITERKQAETEQKKLQLQLLQSQKLSSLGLLVSGVAHEINNPNNLIMLNGDVLRTLWKRLKPFINVSGKNKEALSIGKLTLTQACEKFDNLLAGVSLGSKRIKRIVNDLKSFSRENVSNLKEEVSINEVVDSAYILVGSLIRKSTYNYSVEKAEDLPNVRGNFQKLEQVVINLLTNAAQALTSTQESIHVSSAFDEHHQSVVLTVSDTGPGIAQEDLAKIMDPFYTTKHDVGGTGLGLSVSYGIVKDHGGKIEVESEVGNGTTFRLFLPVVESPKVVADCAT